MRARLGSAALLVVLAALAGCSDDEGSGSPEFDDVASTKGVLADPITFSDEGSTCVSSPGTYLYYASLTSEESLTLTGVDLLAPLRARITASWLAERPADAVLAAGMVLGSRPHADDLEDTGWTARRPLASSTVRPGVDYEYFLELELGRPGGYDAIDFDWTGESGNGTSRLGDRLETEENCA
ncbi:hypothetical protein EKO23_10115 [Nocardioides guangzhouensis]|uniref:Lipoprotein n=1 Tax=Nocardioides guangzhouensis TaxID=2497878 RepID=A0A4Q4ZFU9_9ACTN|nr:hypothetical protein [Nocardioides guangzhouensis]RYP86296.1 hypothetical protein EKO23_10115 [Nocardioides guangzhouensis]